MIYVSTDQAPEQHGGNPSWIDAHYPAAPRPYIDLSTGINPYAYPLPAIEDEWLQRLSDPTEVTAAHTAAARLYGVDAAHIALGAGMQPLMFALACLRMKEHGPSNVMVVSPTYGEHPRVWREAGHSVVHIQSLAEAPDNAVVIVCNPNNPDARTVSPPELLALATRLQHQNGWLIVDESYVEMMPELSIATHAATLPNLVVMRACGKFYGLAGLRVSTAIASARWSAWLRASVGPWPISTAACCMLPAMMNDNAWAVNMRKKLADEARIWRSILATHFTPLGHTDLFTLVATSHANDWYHFLASQGILVRQFSANGQWLRFGLPHTDALERVKTALSKGLSAKP